jgi:hypothetical protein
MSGSERILATNLHEKDTKIIYFFFVFFSCRFVANLFSVLSNALGRHKTCPYII